MGSFFIDPQGAAQRVHNRWFWVGPLVIFSIVSLIASYVMMPMAQHVMETAPLPANTSPEQYQHGMEIGMKIQRMAMYFAPVIAALIFAIEAGVLLLMSAVLSVRARFLELFNLVAGCNLIQVLSAIAVVVILKAKGEVSTAAELRPALGLDIFMHDSSSKVLTGIAGYFTPFEIWWVVMMVFTYSLAFRVTKGKAFTAIAPLMVLGLLLRIVGAVFQR
jgi:hypothetical protein